jgi:hypothetical protein
MLVVPIVRDGTGRCGTVEEVASYSADHGACKRRVMKNVKLRGILCGGYRGSTVVSGHQALVQVGRVNGGCWLDENNLGGDPLSNPGCINIEQSEARWDVLQRNWPSTSVS